MRFIVLFLICLLSAAFTSPVKAEVVDDKTTKENKEQTKKTEPIKPQPLKTETKNQEASESEPMQAPEVEQAPTYDSLTELLPSRKDQEKKDANEEAERFVMPFTKWVEGKLHNSSVVNPTKEQISKKSKNKNGTGLRDAIKQAITQFPGTVLSAEKTRVEGLEVYKVKIISKTGVVRIVTIPSSAEHSTRK